jgi:hypothetical protein
MLRLTAKGPIDMLERSQYSPCRLACFRILLNTKRLLTKGQELPLCGCNLVSQKIARVL